MKTKQHTPYTAYTVGEAPNAVLLAERVRQVLEVSPGTINQIVGATCLSRDAVFTGLHHLEELGYLVCQRGQYQLKD